MPLNGTPLCEVRESPPWWQACRALRAYRNDSLCGCRCIGPPHAQSNKQEAGLMDDEGRNYTGLMPHFTLSLIVLGFVATHTERLRGKNLAVTAEQVCRALNQRC
jgi:hypothetical protein